ncbi:unnamed protein product [Adineta ricciae]|uniref:Uncharacterized protein n=1 Tax=Adineta ricciae TaxID=249248 RepID=A0A815KXA8_ADIRI|nr:unnamed protein product [Adineta ricciae]
MACINGSSPSLSSLTFVTDLPSYGLIGLSIIGLILYFAYIFTFIRNSPTSLSNVYIYFAQFALFLLLISPITFLFRPSASVNVVCPTQTLSLQILPFCLLLGLNVHFAYEWLLKLTNPLRKSCLIAISSFLIFFLGVLIQTAILLIWFYNNNNNNQQIIDQCTNECPRPLFLCSLLFNFFLLFLYSLQSSVRYHFHNQSFDFVYLLTSLLALCVTITWACLYLFLPSKSLYTFYMNTNYILAYGTLFFAYAFVGPFLYERLFYHHQTEPAAPRKTKAHSNQINRMTFKCLSLSKEQQRAFMAAYIKRNLTASYENLTSKNHSSPQPSNPTRHSTLSVESLCPTLISNVSSESPPMFNHDMSNCGTLTSEYFLIPSPNEAIS